MSTGTPPARQKLVAVYSTRDDLEARIVQDLLHKGGIGSYISGPPLFPQVPTTAKREILVLESEAPEANRIISEAGWEIES